MDRLDGMLDRVLDQSDMIHDVATVAAFLLESLPAGRYWLYPAGLHTRALLPYLSQRPDIELAGLIDQNHRGVDWANGLTVIAPADMRHHAPDRVILSHAQYEPALRDHLLQQGVAAQAIQLIYGDAAYRAYGKSPKVEARLLAQHPWFARAAPGEGARCAIVRSDLVTVLEEDALAHILPPAETVIFDIADRDHRVASERYTIIKCYRSLALLRRMLDIISPKIIYLQLNIDRFYIGALIRRWYPQAMILAEVWDLWQSCIDYLDPQDLPKLFNLTPERLQLNRLAERKLLSAVDAIIMKRRGPAFQMVADGEPAQTISVFSGVGEGGLSDDALSRPAPARSTQPKRILYASSMQTWRQLRACPSLQAACNHFDVFQALAQANVAEIDMYNAQHRHADEDPVYAEYLTAFATGKIRYHRAVARAELARRMRDYAYGWIRATPADYTPDHDFVIPASLSSFINAGIPVIIHCDLGYASQLVQRFNAGLVVSGNGHDTVERVRDAPACAHRQGALALRGYMQDHNRQAHQRLQALVKPVFSGGRRGALAFVPLL